ncbi:alpha/beta hydrolase [Bacteroidales bacterium OttesenSCG-928-C19]|nr:alpha/beta hydrolase [Bacteroidales bacterium OttesenSCG-928-C19]
MKKRIALSILTLSFVLNLSAQTCIDRIQNTGYLYVAIPDTIYNEVDSIRFVMSPHNPENPTVIFASGSGNGTLFFTTDEYPDHAFINLPFDIHEYGKDFNFVYISKPGTPLCTAWNPNPPLIDTTYPDIMTFYKMDFLDYYVNQMNQVIDYVNKLSDSPIYLIGGSQGGHVVAKYASVHKDKVKKIVPYSCGILDRLYEEILEWRKQADLGKVSHEDAQKNIDMLHKRYAGNRKFQSFFKQYPNAEISGLPENHYRGMTDCSYNFDDISLNHLLQIDIPILCVYGTDDIKARDNDMLPSFFTRADKENLTMLPKLYCDHFFIERKPNPQTGKVEEKYIGHEVFNEIFQWLKEK